ncbi:hypothetical protein FNH13_02795 [Ornithinimicrobium ciconiae]|uniref:G domain-containing protein n=1 Tax=Ornithinimicrobium ciconiae TaxID=2594265 RepID=A0A516G793_9MICO|nr:hypothetical protein [Ornithinimicrobium ciconiae]QDO87393.1 hypothetical protein FNH13_02795 [Ornithinimicrobium ciconiae]
MATLSPEHLTARRVGHAACTAAWSLLRTHDQPVVAEQAQAIAAGRPHAPSVLFLGEPGKGKSTLVHLLSPHETTASMEERLVNRYRRVIPPRTGSAPLRWLGAEGSASDTFHEGAVGVEVEWSSCALGDDVVLLDTPCEGGIDGPQATVSRMLVRAASVGVFVTDAGAPLLQPEVDYLRAYLRPVDALVVVVTKIDTFPDSWSEVVETNTQVLRDHLRSGIPVVGVSTTMAAHAYRQDDEARRELLLHRSGWTELLSVVSHELRRHAELPMANALRMTEAGLKDLRSHLGQRLAVTHASDQDLAEAMAVTEAEVNRLKERQQEWTLHFDRDIALVRAALSKNSATRLEEWRTTRRAAVRDIKRLSGEAQISALEEEIQQELNAMRALIFSEALDQLRAVLRAQVGEALQDDLIDQFGAEHAPVNRALARVLRDPLDVSSGLTGFFGANLSYSLATSLLHLSNPVGLALAAAGGIGYFVALRTGQHGKKTLSQMDYELARLAKEEREALVGQWDQLIIQLKPEIVPAYRKLLGQKIQEKGALLTEQRKQRGASISEAERSRKAIEAAIQSVDDSLVELEKALGLLRAL